MGLEVFAAKIVFFCIFMLFLMWVIRPVVALIGIIPCTNCGGFINTMFFVMIPMITVFIGIYKIVGIFRSRST